MKFSKIKGRIGKFLLGESGSMSKHTIISAGIISFILSSSPTIAGMNDLKWTAKGDSQYEDDNTFAVNFKGDMHGSHTANTMPNRTMHFDGTGTSGRHGPNAIILRQALMSEGLLNDVTNFAGYHPLGTGSVPLELDPRGPLNCGHLSDHLSGGIACELSDHFNSYSDIDGTSKTGKSPGEYFLVPNVLLHNNALHINLENDFDGDFGSSLAQGLSANHTHDAMLTGDAKYRCHASDHYDGHAACSSHASNSIGLG